MAATEPPPFPSGSGTEERLPSFRDLVARGREFLERIFRSSVDDEIGDGADAVLRPSDHKWVQKRLERLGPMADGRPRVVPKAIWDLSVLLQHRVEGRAAFRRFAPRVPTEFLQAAAAVALLRADGAMRPIDGVRGQSMLALAILLWLLADPDPDGGTYGYVIRGLPYGVFCELLARFENYGERRAPHVNTVWGTHRARGTYLRAQNGYMAALRQAGLIRTKQPPWWTVGPGFRGQPFYNKSGDRECWAFVEIRLRIPAPGGERLDMKGHEYWLHDAVPLPPPNDYALAQATWLFEPPGPEQLSLPQPVPDPQTSLVLVAELERLDAEHAGDELDRNAARARLVTEHLRRTLKPNGDKPG